MRAVALGLVLAAVAAESAAARRVPTVPERAEIRGAMALTLSSAPPACYASVIYVSTVDRHYAYAAPRWRATATCLRYASDGYFILRRTTHWRVVFNGSDPPPCAKVPKPVVQDLLRLRCR